mgnify:CR=1 FL=1
MAVASSTEDNRFEPVSVKEIGKIEIEEITAVQLEIVQHGVEMGSGQVRCEFSEWDPVSELVPDGDGLLVAMLSDNTIPAGRVLRRIERQAAARQSAA